MSEQWAKRVVGNGSSRAFRLVIGHPSWAARIALIVAMLVLFALLAVIVIPLALIGAALVVVAAIAGRVHGRAGGLGAPSGVLDERRNVRVIVRE